MINAYAASEPKGKLEPFAYDPGELKPHEVEINVHFSIRWSSLTSNPPTGWR